MPTDAALLPPDPTKPVRYWLKTHDGLDVIGAWNPAGHWKVDGWRTLAGPVDLHYCGYTLATRHPIPGPAALEAVYAMLAKMDRQAVDYEGTMANGTLIHGHIKMLRDGLRAALETKETT